MSLRFNPTTGELDLVDDNLPGNIKKTYQASETISALKMVSSTGLGEIGLADNTNMSQAQTIGMAITSGNAGDDIEVINFGQIDDASFLFGVNTCLFLGLNGNITPIAPTSGHNVPIGKSLSNGSIFIDIDNITIL